MVQVLGPLTFKMRPRQNLALESDLAWLFWAFEHLRVEKTGIPDG